MTPAQIEALEAEVEWYRAQAKAALHISRNDKSRDQRMWAAGRAEAFTRCELRLRGVRFEGPEPATVARPSTTMASAAGSWRGCELAAISTPASVPRDTDTDKPKTATLPERLTIMWQNSRTGRSGYVWDVPIQVTGKDPASQAGNVVAIVHLGGPGGTQATQVACEAFAKELVDAYNAKRRADDS